MKTLTFVLAGFLLSANSFAGLIQADFNWSSGYLDEQSNYEYQPYQSGVASFLYEEGTNVISALKLFDVNNNLLFLSTDDSTVVFPHTFAPDIPLWDGYSTDPLSMQELASDDFFSLAFTEIVAFTSSVDVLPSLDDASVFHGVLTSATRTLMFDTGGLLERKAVASVPEPATTLLFMLSLGVLLLCSGFRSTRITQWMADIRPTKAET